MQGVTSGATGFVKNRNINSGSGTVIDLVNVSGTFQNGEKIIASDSAETGKIIENNTNVDLNDI